MSGRALAGAARREATRTAILDAFRRLLDGPQPAPTVTVSEVVREAQVSRAAFYLHFEDKRALVAALTRREVAVLMRAVEAYAQVPPPLDRPMLQAAVETLCEQWRRKRRVLSSLVELAENDPEVRAMWRATAQGNARIVAQTLSRYREDLDDEVLDALAVAIVWSAERVMHQMIGRADPGTAVAPVAEALTEIIWSICAR